MTTIGKVCLWLTVIGLGVISVWLLPTIGKQHNEISVQLSDTKSKLDTAIDTQRLRMQELSQRMHQLSRLQIGWDKRWVIHQTANSGVEIHGARLVVTGLGLDFGLRPVLDDDGQPAPPAMHAFKTMPDGGMFYVGEFRAEQLDAVTCTLVPVRQVTEDEVDIWLSSPELAWRFRTQVPSAKRRQIDQLHVHLQELLGAYAETEANIAQQVALREQAEKQLTTRRQELLGSPDAGRTLNRPEYSEGLLRTISAEEEIRNELLVQIDVLRRRLKEAGEKQTELLHRVRESSKQLPSAGNGQITQSGSVVQ